MKRFIVGFLFVSAMAPWLLCEAGDNSTAGEKKKLSNSTEQQQKMHANHRSHATMARSERAGFCNDRYCVHASHSPWWPGAPGD